MQLASFSFQEEKGANHDRKHINREEEDKVVKLFFALSIKRNACWQI
jgi:hypothetical protein